MIGKEGISDNDYIVDTIRNEFHRAGLAITSLILFGSRSRNEEREGSDWDFVAVIDRELSWREKMDLWLRISRRLSARSLAADIVIKTEKEIASEKDDTGRVAYYAMKEGVAL
ncbi:MAG: nucleotidyltransferase domain-containing protein [Spirochaetes bacterium]|nr:nucleotidyltransferase domain-containing protein [Spirochaetota bacterium]